MGQIDQLHRCWIERVYDQRTPVDGLIFLGNMNFDGS